MSSKIKDWKDLWTNEVREVICPRCQKPMQLNCRWRRRGAIAGVLSGAALAWKSLRAGTSPLGVMACLATGAALGAATGVALGEVLDRDIISSYKCQACGCTCRLNE